MDFMDFAVHAGKGDARRGTYILNYLDGYYVDNSKLTAILEGGGKESDIALKLGTYATVGDIALRKMGEMISGKNTKGIGELAGQLKDASEALGAVRVGDYAEELEWECNNPKNNRANYDRIKETMKGLSESWKETQSQFKHVVEMINEDTMGRRLDYNGKETKAEALTTQSNTLLDWVENDSEPVPILTKTEMTKVKSLEGKSTTATTTLGLAPLIPTQSTPKQPLISQPILKPSLMSFVAPTKVEPIKVPPVPVSTPLIPLDMNFNIKPIVAPPTPPTTPPMTPPMMTTPPRVMPILPPQPRTVPAITPQPMLSPSIMTPLTPTKAYSLLDFGEIAPKVHPTTSQSCDLLDWTELNHNPWAASESFNLIDL